MLGYFQRPAEGLYERYVRIGYAPFPFADGGFGYEQPLRQFLLGAALFHALGFDEVSECLFIGHL